MVGAPGFEPGTSASRTLRASRLRYAPTASHYNTSVPGKRGEPAMAHTRHLPYNARPTEREVMQR